LRGTQNCLDGFPSFRNAKMSDQFNRSAALKKNLGNHEGKC
jgi:hypothetical protein